MTSADLIDLLAQGELRFPPLTTKRVETGVTWESGGQTTELDAILGFRWGEREYAFAVECSRLWTPRAIAAAADQALRLSAPPRFYPLVLAPYLPGAQLATLESRGVSGLDLCGNGVLVVPNELLVYRTGFPNRFPRQGLIKNVYRRNSSIAARVFLLRPEFDSVSSALAEIRRRGGEVTLATVSKVCASLEGDLVLERSRGEATASRRLRLLQPDKLLEFLADNYALPEIGPTFTGKSTLTPDELRQALDRWQAESGGRVVLTGATSVDAYAVMAREPVQSFYCSDVASALRWLGDRVQEGSRFATLTLLETRDEFVYFDRRPGLVASPIQTYLELAADDKRSRETAEQVRAALLAPFKDTTGTGCSDGSAPQQPA